MNYVAFFLLSLGFLATPEIAATVASGATRGQTSLDYCSTDGDLLQDFCKPIRFTRSGMSHFFRNVFNSGRYATDYLPFSFSHLIQFLDYGLATKQERVYFESSMRLFLNKIKSVRFVTAENFEELATKLAPVMTFCLKSQALSFQQIIADVKNALYEAFSNKFSFFKNDTDQFFDELSGDITAILRNHVFVNETISTEQLKNIQMRFLETALSKVIWSPSDQENVWKSVKSIAARLTNLADEGAMNRDELDDLFRSLLESFIRFLDVAGTQLNDDVIDLMKKDCEPGQLLFLSLDEQEEELQTKRERLLDILCLVKARKFAQKQGMILEPVTPKTGTVGVRTKVLGS